MRFRDRFEAGARLARELERYSDDDPIVIGLTRGGVPVAAAVASALGAPLDVLVVRKLGAPFQEELGLGAIAEGGGRWIDTRLAALTGTSLAEVGAIERRERAVLDERIERYRARHPRASLERRTVIVVDDGMATGVTVRAAIASIRAVHPRRLVLAVPVAASSSLRELAGSVDVVACLHACDDLGSVGRHYEVFDQVSDDVVLALLGRNARARAAASQRPPRPLPG